ncbi:hypothetical protein DFH07DRAFT_850779 [Mycena maculata]|uniref:DUF6534 domain-containing protein n=1 Tax=Mycena maculata TaxID=230809 RepID=A0AAD7MQQ8_9AGAR|nr:hypothetical protein DFH07DRAFT_850779 [Mycena maculata]
MGTYDLTLGCLLFASWANMVLFTLELTQIYQYFTRYPRDAWFNQASVIVALLSDFTTVFACLSACYLYMVTHWGTESYLLTQPWCAAVYVVGTSISAAVIQLWLARMVWNLTKQWYWLPIISVCILVGLTGAGATAGLIVIDSSYSAREGLVKWITLWLSACSAADTIVTTVLVIKFNTIKTTFTDTKSLIRRLSIAAVRNGSITTIMTVITLVVFRLQPETNSAVMIEMTIGRVYTLSMLSNLNNRATLLGDSQTSGSNRKTTDNPNSTIVRIQQDVETHYHTDADAIQMGDLEYGAQKTREISSNDRHSDVNLVVKVQDDKPYDKGF